MPRPYVGLGLAQPELQAPEEPTEETKPLQIIFWNAVGVEMHDIVSDAAHVVQILDEDSPVDGETGLFPPRWFFQEPQVFPEGQPKNSRTVTGGTR